jgi:hypothetical protein
MQGKHAMQCNAMQNAMHVKEMQYNAKSSAMQRNAMHRNAMQSNEMQRKLQCNSVQNPVQCIAKCDARMQCIALH